jgi:Rhs element Vgr protein
LLTRAEANGKLVVTKNGKLIVKKPDGSAAAALALRFGGNLLEFEAVLDARSQYSSVQASSWSAADQGVVSGEGAAASPVAPGNVSGDTLGAVLGASIELKHGGGLEAQELKAWADAEKTRSAFAKVRGRARFQGFAGINPGDAIELAGVGARFAGKAFVSGVRHELDSRNWETDVAFGCSEQPFGCSERSVTEAPAGGLLPAVTGLQVGLVTALEGDPAGHERIQVRLPKVDPDGEGVWARLASLDAGAERGAVFRPEIDDEVVVGFFDDDPRAPVVLGQLHSAAKASPIPGSDDNHEKGFVTRGGIQLKFDDDKLVLTLKTPNGNTLTLSDEDGGITLQDENGNKIVMSAAGITLESAADVSIKAPSGDVKVEGTNVEATAQAQFKAEGSGGAEVSSSANTTIKGSLVQIN